jgi:hypothetical protein
LVVGVTNRGAGTRNRMCLATPDATVDATAMIAPVNEVVFH